MDCACFTEKTVDCEITIAMWWYSGDVNSEALFGKNCASVSKRLYLI